MKIYADILVFENCLVNFFLLTITMKCTKRKCSFLPLMFSSFVGGIYTLVIFIPKLNILSCLPFALIVAFIMLRVVYGKTNMINMIRVLVIFLLISFTLSGICFLLSLNQNSFIIGKLYKLENFSLKNIILGIMFIYLILNRIIDNVKERLIIGDLKFGIEFEVEKKVYNFEGFLDTGNELIEPITNLPCILIEENLIKDINFNRLNSYFILYSAIGYDGNLKGIRVNDIKVTKNDCFYEKIDAIICPCKEKLSKENDFNALLSRGVAYKGDIYGKTNSVF